MPPTIKKSDAAKGRKKRRPIQTKPTAAIKTQQQHRMTIMDSQDAEEDDDEDISPDWLSNTANFLSPEVSEVLSGLSDSKKKRVKNEISEAMKSIKNRVLQAVQNVGEDEKESEGEPRTRNRPPHLDMKVQREKLSKQKKLLGKIADYVEDCANRLCLLTDVHDWIRRDHGLGSIQLDDAQMDRAMKDQEENYVDVMDSLDDFERCIAKLLNLTYRIMEETGLISSKDKKNLPEKVPVYDESALLKYNDKWEMAITNITSSLDDAIRWVKVPTFKNVVRTGARQFKMFIQAVMKKVQSLAEINRLLHESKKKNETMKTSKDKIEREIDDYRKKMSEFLREIAELKTRISEFEEQSLSAERSFNLLSNKLKDLDICLKKKELECSELTKKNLDLEQEFAAAKVEIALLQARPIQEHKESPSQDNWRESNSDSMATIQELTKLRNEVADVRSTNAKLSDRIKDLEKQLRSEEDKSKTLHVTLEETRAKLAAMGPPKDETTIMLEKPPPENNHVPINDNYYKTLINGMKNDFNAELEKIREHVRREKQRSGAEVRRLEQTHKDNLVLIQKENNRLLRSIEHFKESIGDIFVREHLKENLNELRRLPGLVTSQLAPNPLQWLGQLSTCVVDYMKKVGDVIANGFLTMRMKAKIPDIREQKAVQIKEMQYRTEAVEQMKKTTENAVNSLGKLRKRLKGSALKRFQETIEQNDSLQNKDKKYIGLMERYKMVWGMYNKLQKEMDTLNVDFEDMIDNKVAEREQLLVSQITMEMKEKKAYNTEQLHLSLADQRKNIRLLDRAYDDNKISKDLYSMAREMLCKAMSLPSKRIRYLMEKYIAFRALKDAQVQLQNAVDSRDMDGDKRAEVLLFMEKMKERYEASMVLWNQQLRSMEKERKQVFHRIWQVFNDVLVETGILLIHPLLQARQDTPVSPDLTTAMGRQRRMGANPFRRRRKAITCYSMPESIDGSSMMLYGNKGLHSLTLPNICDADTEPSVTIPHMYLMDVNRRRIVAQRALQRMTKPVKKMIPLAVSRSYMISSERLVYINEANRPDRQHDLIFD